MTTYVGLRAIRLRGKKRRLTQLREEERMRMMKEGIKDEELLRHAAEELAKERYAAEQRNWRW